MGSLQDIYGAVAMKFFFQKSGPFVHCCRSEITEELIFASFQQLDVKVIGLSGLSMRSVASMFSEFAKGFEFPDYFGGNTDAFLECIRDLDWYEADGYIVVIEDGDELLADETHEAGWFIDLMESVGKSWSEPVEEGEAWDRPSKPFHTIIKTVEGRDLRFSRSETLAVVE